MNTFLHLMQMFLGNQSPRSYPIGSDESVAVPVLRNISAISFTASSIDSCNSLGCLFIFLFYNNLFTISNGKIISFFLSKVSTFQV